MGPLGLVWLYISNALTFWPSSLPPLIRCSVPHIGLIPLIYSLFSIPFMMLALSSSRRWAPGNLSAPIPPSHPGQPILLFSIIEKPCQMPWGGRLELFGCHQSILTLECFTSSSTSPSICQTIQKFRLRIVWLPPPPPFHGQVSETSGGVPQQNA